MLTQHGGWPLNAFCFPDGRPFFGGTYFPPADNSRGIIPWPQLLMRVADYYAKNRAALVENADNIVMNMQVSNVPPGENMAWDNRVLLKAAQSIGTFHDDTWGGFGGAPKFPPAMTLNFLLAVRATAGVETVPGLAEKLDGCVNITGRAMAHGGIFDQFGGGFCRYSVDGQWLIPHFEKMLYDNALLLDFYAKAHRRYQKPLYAAVVEETVGWLIREMKHQGGAFYSALDADTDGHEGLTYVWTPAQVREVLGDESAGIICATYNITDAGNFEHGASNPALVEDNLEKRAALAPMRAKLLAARQERPQPGRDTKILLAWNALLVRGLAEAAFAFGKKEWFAAAQQCVDWLWKNLSFADEQGHRRLHAVYYDTDAVTQNSKPETQNSKPAFIDDYAFLAEAFMTLAAYADWAEPGSELLEQNVARARALVASIRAHFRDPKQLGYFFTADDQEKLAVRKKEWWDNALPSGHASLAHVLAGLYALTGENAYAAELGELKKCFAGLAARTPMGVSHALAAFTWDAIGVAVLKVKGPCDWDALQAALAAKPYRLMYLVAAHDPAQPEGMQLCVGTQCAAPTKDLAELMDQI